MKEVMHVKVTPWQAADAVQVLADRLSAGHKERAFDINGGDFLFGAVLARTGRIAFVDHPIPLTEIPPNANLVAGNLGPYRATGAYWAFWATGDGQSELTIEYPDEWALALKEYRDLLVGELQRLGWVEQSLESDAPTTAERREHASKAALAKRELLEFKKLVERQLHRDIMRDGTAQEDIARALLQAFLAPRSYREVPVRGGQTDLLAFDKDGRFLYETKIWRGPEYYHQGLREIGEYILGEDDDGALAGIFYLVFDPTKGGQAAAHLGGAETTVTIHVHAVNVVVICIAPPIPSKKA